MPIQLQYSLQNASSPMMEEIIFLNNHAFSMLILIMTVITYNMMSILINKNINLNMFESHQMETMWSTTPIIILVLIGIPSIKVLYMMDESLNFNMTIKTMGHQWYWSYQLMDKEKNSFLKNYYLSKEKKMMRVLDVDNRLVINKYMKVRNLISSNDVIHSWTIPSAGVKMDAIPGRLNQINMQMNMYGVFYGQCSEICGANHSFMPIVVEINK